MLTLPLIVSPAPDVPAHWLLNPLIPKAVAYFNPESTFIPISKFTRALNGSY